MRYISIISKSFSLNKNKIKKKHKLEKYNWDSMTKINLISFINDKYGKNLDHTKLKKIVSFEDLDNLIEKTIKK